MGYRPEIVCEEVQQNPQGGAIAYLSLIINSSSLEAPLKWVRTNQVLQQAWISIFLRLQKSERTPPGRILGALAKSPLMTCS